MQERLQNLCTGNQNLTLDQIILEKKVPPKKPAIKKDTEKKITGRQDIVKESKKKPEPPTRALNDPRDN
jgi:hypothetical protein